VMHSSHMTSKQRHLRRFPPLMVTFEEGDTARCLGRAFLACPYDRLTPEWEEWRAGWLRADHDLRTGGEQVSRWLNRDA